MLPWMSQEEAYLQIFFYSNWMEVETCTLLSEVVSESPDEAVLLRHANVYVRDSRSGAPEQ